MRFLMLVFILLAPFSQAATLQFSEELVPLRVDDKKISHSFFSTTSKVTVQLGKRMVQVKYKDLYETDYDEHETIESEPFWVSVNVQDPDGVYLVSMPRPDDIEKAYEYVKKPFVTLAKTGDSSKPIMLKPVTVPVISVAQNNEVQSSIQHLNKNIGNSVKAQISAPVSKSPNATAMLEFWWNQATAEERKQFLESKKGN